MAEPDKKADQPVRLPYKSPRLVKLGSFKDLTRAVGTTGGYDGGSKKGQTRTR